MTNLCLILQWWTVWSRSVNTGILHYVQDDDFTGMANQFQGIRLKKYSRLLDVIVGGFAGNDDVVDVAFF